MVLEHVWRSRDADIRTFWSYSFRAGPDHWTAEQLRPLRNKHDLLADECLELLDRISPPARVTELARSHTASAAPTLSSGGKLSKFEGDVDPYSTATVPSFARSSSTGHAPTIETSIPTPSQSGFHKDGEKETSCPASRRDMFALLSVHHHSHPKLGELWKSITAPPEWVDFAQIGRGQEVFYRYGGAMLTGLAYHSLLGGMGGSRVVETLARTGGFSTKVARRRLFETTQLILRVTRSPESMMPPRSPCCCSETRGEKAAEADSIGERGSGVADVVRVRFLHASVRRRILILARSRPSYYNVAELGVPVSDLDSIGTITTFCSSLMWISLPRQGLFLTNQEQEDFLALWRYIAYLIGCPDEVFSSPGRAKAMMESLVEHEISPSPTSVVLANNLVAALRDAPPAYASEAMLLASARWLNGSELCDALALPRTPWPASWYYTALFAGQCAFFCAVCYSHRAIPTLDRRKISLLRSLFWRIIVDSSFGLQGTETLYEFKHVPQLGFLTDNDSDDAGLERWDMRGVERRNLRWLCFAVLGFGIGTWSAWHLVRYASVTAYGLINHFSGSV